MQFNLKSEPMQDQSAPVTESGYWEEDPDTRISEIQFTPKNQKKKKQPEPDPANAANQGEPSTSSIAGKESIKFPIPKDNTATFIKLLELDPGVILEPDRTGGWICPVCNSGNGPHGTGLSYDPKADTPKYHCFSGCEESRDTITLYALANNLVSVENSKEFGAWRFKTAEKMAKRFGFPWVPRGAINEIAIKAHFGNSASSTSKRHATAKTDKNNAKKDLSNWEFNNNLTLQKIFQDPAPHPAKDYLQSRGFTWDILQRFNIGFLEDHYFRGLELPVIVIPTSDNCVNLRILPEYVGIPIPGENDKVPKYIKLNGAKIFNLQAVNKSNEIIFIAEGALDALIIEQCGFTAIGMPNAKGGIQDLENKLAEVKPANITFILCMDSDSDGSEGAANLKKTLEGAGYKYYWPTDLLDSDSKDPNEAYIADPDGFISRLHQAYGAAQYIATLDSTPASQPETDSQGDTEKTEKQKQPFSDLTIYYDGKTFKHDLFADDFANLYHVGVIDDQVHIYHNGIYVRDLLTIKRYIKKVIPSLSIHLVNEVLADLQTRAPILQPETTPTYIGFTNGVLDLHSMELLPHSPDIVLTSQIPHNYTETPIANPAAVNLVENFLNGISNNDPERRKVIEEMAGVLFYPSNRELEKIFILTGSGRNGKSTLIEFLQYLLGDENYSTVMPSQMGKERFHVANLYHKLANFSDEESGKYYDDEVCTTLRRISSGNQTTGEYKGKDPFKFCPYSTPIIAANTIPRFSATSTGAMYPRLEGAVIQFENQFTGNKADTSLKRNLATEDAAGHMIRLAMQALHDLIERGFTLTTCKADYGMARKIITDADSVRAWLDELESDMNLENVLTYLCGRPKTVVYEDYRTWCKESGYDNIVKQGKFYKTLAETYHLDPNHKSDGARYFKVI